MIRERPLWLLVAAAVATYPALAVGACVATVLSTQPAARQLGLAGHPAALAAVALVAVGAAALLRSFWTIAECLGQTHRLHRWVADHQVPLPEPLAAVTAEVGLSGRIRMVATAERAAMTAGLARPYVVATTGLVAALSDAELRAVLAHEQTHLRRRDPLRVLLARLLVAHLWFLPVAADLRSRAESGYELAADRYAADRYGGPALAGALLQAMSLPAPAGPGPGGRGDMAVARFAADRELLATRVSQLESGRRPRPAPLRPARAALTVAGAVALLAAVGGAWAFMLLTCPSL